MRLPRLVIFLMGGLLLVAAAFGTAVESNPAAKTKAYPIPEWMIHTIDDMRVEGYNVSVATDSISGETFVMVP